MGVSSPTGMGEKRGMEFAGQPGTPLGLRPERAKANQAASPGSHDMDNEMADQGYTMEMREDPTFTPVRKYVAHHPAPDRAHEGDPYMGSKAQITGKMNR